MKEERLPQSAKEGVLYGGVICFITVVVMLFLNIGVAFGTINKEAIIAIVTLLPIIWVVAMLVETVIVGKISEKLVEKFVAPTDGFNTKILFNIVFCVTGMSMIMTIVGSMIGNGEISMEPFTSFLSHWPRNFCVAFWCEILLAQPAGRFVMKMLHHNQTKKIAEMNDMTEEYQEIS